MPTLIEIAWVAGLMEGEGSFASTKHGSPFMTLQMNDKDVLEKLCSILGVAKLYGPYRHRRGENYDTPHYRVTAYSTSAIEWMLTIWPLMGMRRRAKIIEVVNKWRTKPIRQQGNRRGIYNPKCIANQEEI